MAMRSLRLPETVPSRRLYLGSTLCPQGLQRESRRSCRAMCTAVAPAQALAVPANALTATRVRMKTRSDCQLGISVYPIFNYNAVGGGGWGTVTPMPDGRLFLRFDCSAMVIPDLSFRTASIFMVPIPPPINIAIQPLRLEGTLDPITGEVGLEFDAKFNCTATGLYTPPPLLVNTLLTTESAQGRMRNGTGKRLVGGVGTLVGVAQVEKVEDFVLSTFLMLPTDALAVMSSEFEFAD